MDTLTIGIVSATLAFLVGIAGCALIEREASHKGADSVTMNDLGPKLLLRACPAAFVASAFITLGAALANA